MASTSAFGWETPDDTDLVKDGAAAIRTLGNSIDTSMADLKGGTSGQVLSKASNTDMDFTWVTSDDANAIQNAIVDAKGDLIAASAADTPARLAVGTDGYGLTAASGETTGLKWTPTYGSTVSIQRATSNQTIAAGAWTKIQLNSEAFDTDGSYDPTTNFRFTPKVAGYYLFNPMIFITQNLTDEVNLAIYVNGSFNCLVDLKYNSKNTVYGHSVIIPANGSSDYFEFYLYTGTNSVDIANRSGGSPTTITWLRGL